MFENSEQQQQPCVICYQPHEQMLMLSCVHDPCINCAATHYVENEPQNSPIYTCSKCGQETPLDKSSVVELQKVYNSIKARKKKVSTPGTYKDTPQEVDYRDTDKMPVRSRNQPATYSRAKQPEDSYGSRMYPSAPVSQPSYSGVGAAKKAIYQPTYPCNDHPEEELTYYCFTCNRPICPECAIHGQHREHEVQTTRKAIKQIKSLLMEDRQKLDAEINEMVSNREQAKRLSKEWAEQNKRDQDFIRKKIAVLKNALNEKQKELVRASETNLERNCEILRTQTMATQKTLEQMAAIKRSLELSLKKQDLAVLQEFNKRDEEANEAINLADRQRDKIREQQVKNPLRCVDLTALDEDIDRIIGQLHALKLTTAIPKS